MLRHDEAQKENASDIPSGSFTKLPDWRETAAQPKEPRSKEDDTKIIAEIDHITNAPPANRDFSHDEVEAMVIQRSIPVHRGKWRMVPPEVEK
jgi:hypothetical protein